MHLSWHFWQKLEYRKAVNNKIIRKMVIKCSLYDHYNNMNFQFQIQNIFNCLYWFVHDVCLEGDDCIELCLHQQYLDSE